VARGWDWDWEWEWGGAVEDDIDKLRCCCLTSGNEGGEGEVGDYGAGEEATAAIKFEFAKWELGERGAGGELAAGVFLSRIN